MRNRNPVTFDPGERHKIRGLEDARFLLMLAPWPARENTPTIAPHQAFTGKRNQRADRWSQSAAAEVAPDT